MAVAHSCWRQNQAQLVPITLGHPFALQSGAQLEAGDVKAAAGTLRCEGLQLGSPAGSWHACGHAHSASLCAAVRLTRPALPSLSPPAALCPVALPACSGSWVREFEASANKLSYSDGSKSSGEQDWLASV